MTVNHHGYPVRDWTLADITVKDCECGAPVYDLPRYGEGAPVRLDALPLRTFTLAGHAEPYASLEYSDDPRFTEHVCPMGQA